MGGPGAPFLKKELSEAQFVAIGEEHGTREVPQFVWATCRAMAQNSLDAMAIESGPLVTALLQQWTAKNGGSTNLAAFEKQYPDSIAFFNWRQEFDLLSHCQQALLPISSTCGVSIRSFWAHQIGRASCRERVSPYV